MGSFSFFCRAEGAVKSEDGAAAGGARAAAPPRGRRDQVKALSGKRPGREGSGGTPPGFPCRYGFVR